SGIEAYRAEQYETALQHFEAATVADPNNAEAFFLLARVLFDTPLRDEGRAGDAIERARDLDPENLQYMVAELQQLRTDTWNFLQEMQRTSARLSLAREILERDPTNSFAHEELGSYYIRDFYYYRNAIAFPTLSFGSRGVSGVDTQEDDISDQIYDNEVLGAFGSDQPGQTPNDPDIEADIPDFFEYGAITNVGATDRFDLDALKSQGAGVIELHARADRVYDRAVYHLETAIANDPRRRGVYDHLMRLHALANRWDQAVSVATQMLVYFPEDVEMWLYLGLANHRLGRDDAAETCYREAFERMDESQRGVFEDISLLLPEEELDEYRENPDALAARFWTSQEPRYLTPYNERKIEHYARLTYADLMFASEDVDLRGWETERGKIHVRYGVPQSDVMIHGGFQRILEQFNTRYFDDFAVSTQEMDANRFNIWDYGDFRFVFEDPLNSGEFRLYSPPADLFAVVGGGAVERYDYEMIARETFRENPEEYDYSPPGRQIGLPYLVTNFKGEEG
ncbi:MAG: GWxTD domain-containing protein, partial [Rubricoccaceae bacterium]|nr:GWxTD domain-containing protein [Rubricoccaceae bacterium]